MHTCWLGGHTRRSSRAAKTVIAGRKTRHVPIVGLAVGCSYGFVIPAAPCQAAGSVVKRPWVQTKTSIAFSAHARSAWLAIRILLTRDSTQAPGTMIKKKRMAGRCCRSRRSLRTTLRAIGLETTSGEAAVAKSAGNDYRSLDVATGTVRWATGSRQALWLAVVPQGVRVCRDIWRIQQTIFSSDIMRTGKARGLSNVSHKGKRPRYG
mmetsp:Transcript_4608/g.10123  ORF Transcript_4608/g.10123 Transcript_4608/m.10123 type:complete len:208 (-) Transcript_4608:26-649(-)